MKLEDQLTSLELSKRLKELGVKQDSYFYHFNEPYRDGTDDWRIDTLQEYDLAHPDKSEKYSAFSVAELGIMLPKEINGYHLFIKFYEHENSFEIWYEDAFGSLFENKIEAEKKEADSRAKMLIYLIKNNFVKVEDINGT